MPGPVPAHVALIMDGNRRWARARRRSREAGYRAGIARARELVDRAADRGVAVLTLFAFSAENRRRPRPEVELLMRLFAQALDERADELRGRGAQLRFLGDLERLPAAVRRRAARAQAAAPERPRITVCVALHYGGRQDLLAALARLPAGADEAAVSAALSTAGLPDPDLLVRTGGERRLSNFLLWQCAYTELYFTDCLWPDFTAERFDAALDWYAERERRFGAGPA